MTLQMHVLFYLYIHQSYLLVKFEYFNRIICFTVDDFLFLTPFSLIFCTFSDPFVVLVSGDNISTIFVCNCTGLCYEKCDQG